MTKGELDALDTIDDENQLPEDIEDPGIPLAHDTASSHEPLANMELFSTAHTVLFKTSRSNGI